MADAVNHPDHYVGPIECKDAMRSAMDAEKYSILRLHPMAAYWWGCAFKYIWRWPVKNGVEDLRKCCKCLEFLIEEIEHEN